MSVIYPRAESKATVYVGKLSYVRRRPLLCRSFINCDGNGLHLCSHLGGFGDEMDEEKLYAAFVTFGDIVEVFIPRDVDSSRSNGKHKGFGFVEYERSEDARAAIDNMHMNEIFGHVIRCNIARPTRIMTAAALGASGMCTVGDCFAVDLLPFLLTIWWVHLLAWGLTDSVDAVDGDRHSNEDVGTDGGEERRDDDA